MSFRFNQFLAEGIAQLSYLVGDDHAGVAAVIDPRPDVAVYLRAARRQNLAITHIFETHIHADFMSGARELASRCGSAEIHVSAEGGAAYGFDHERVRDGQDFEFGKVVITARHTPGHTPEHMAYEICLTAHPPRPWAVLSGDSLFADSAGRPDLMGDEQEQQLVEQLYDTLREYYARLDGGVLIYPAHGQGSPCGPAIGDRLCTSIGYERAFNPYMRDEGREAFRRRIRESAPPEPAYYRRMKQLNGDGPPLLGAGPIVPALTPDAFGRAVQQQGALVLDVRHMLAFGGGHIEGALNVAARPELSVWAGWMIDPEQPILLVMDRDSDLEGTVCLLVRTGYTRFAGYLAGGMTAWENAALPMQGLPQMTVREVAQLDGDGAQVLDVRDDEEWSGGHIPGAMHRFVPELRTSLAGIDRDQPVIVYCDSGFRANIAASLLQSAGFADVRSVPGSWRAWTAAGLPVENGGAQP